MRAFLRISVHRRKGVAAPECKTVGRMLTHIAFAVRFWDDVHRKQRRTAMQGVDFFAMAERADAEEREQAAPEGEDRRVASDGGGRVCSVAGDADTGVSGGDGDRRRRENGEIVLRMAAWRERA